MDNKVAIIGVSLALPKSETIEDFNYGLENGIDCVTKVPDERLILLGLDTKKEYIKHGVLNYIDEFDPSFFNLSKYESDYMDPQMRYNLILACKAIENAGYKLKDFNSTNTVVYTIASDPEYYKNFIDIPPVALTGNHPGMYAGRIAYFLNLQGSAIVINTLCSSFLVALHEAAIKIKIGETKTALVGGISLKNNFNIVNQKDILGLLSPDNKCKSFDKNANGIIGGEGGGYLLLKNLEDSIKDRDNILAIIKGSAINQDGATSNGITSPSPIAQSEVMIKAWENGNIHPEQLSYIEAHGSGTQLGDAIEFEALNIAFKKFTNQKKICPIGSVKSNIGHTGNMAGFAGLLKAILTIKNKTIFPSLHFESPNTYINYKDSSLYVNTTLNLLDKKSNPIIVGINSFGLSGTNAHVLLEEYIQHVPDQIQEFSGVVKFSAKSKYSLKKYLQEFSKLINNKDLNLNNICCVQNVGRDDYNFRTSISYNCQEDLIKKIDLINDLDVYFVENNISENIFYFPPKINISLSFLELKFKWDKNFTQSVRECLAFINPSELPNLNSEVFIIQYSLYKMLNSLDIKANKLIGEGIGKIVSSVLANELSLEKALKEINFIDFEKEEFNHEKFSEYILKLAENKNLNIIELGNQETVKKHFKKIDSEKIKILSAIIENELNPISNLLSKLYNYGYDINFSKLYKTPYKKIRLPNYQFQKQKCWIQSLPNTKNDIPINNELNEFHQKFKETRTIEKGLTTTQYRLAQIWSNAFKKEEISIHQDFYELGGNSLMGIRIINLIQEEFKVNVRFENIFYHNTVYKLAQYIELLDSYSYTNIIPVIPQENYELSNSQMRMWLIDKFENNGSFAYNLTTPFQIENLDVEILIRSVKIIINRHESLRTNFIEVLGKPRQIIRQEFEFEVTRIDIIDEAEKEKLVENIIIQQQNTLFDLSNDLLIRVTLVAIDINKYVLILNTHHIITDLWSLKIITKELHTIYRLLKKGEEVILPALKLQYKDYAAWYNAILYSDDIVQHKEYWINKLSKNIVKLNLPIDYKRPQIFTYKGESIIADINKDVIEKVKCLEIDYKITSFMFWQAVINVLLYKITDTRDIIIGSPFANRPHIALSDQVGFYLDTVSLYNRIDENDNFIDILLKVKKTTIEAFEHQIYPIDFIIDDLKIKRDASRNNPIFDVMLVYVKSENLDTEVLQIKEYRSKNINIVSRFDLIFYILELEDKIQVKVEYNIDLFKENTIRHIMDSLTKMTQFLIEHRDEKVELIYLNSDRIASKLRSTEKNDFKF